METFIGTILPVAFNYAPPGWALCDGSLLPISQNSALFAVLGTSYGGDGVHNFALPDMRGRTPVGQGAGPGLQPMQMGQSGGEPTMSMTLNGAATVALSAANLPTHSHDATFSPSGGPLSVTVHASTSPGVNAVPMAGDFLAAPVPGGPGAAIKLYRPDAGSASVALNAAVATASGSATGGTVAVQNTGEGRPLAAPVTVSGSGSVMQPYTGINFIICLNGLFPSRQ